MQEELLYFLSMNSSAVFGLLGAVSGGAITFLSTLFLKKRDFELQIWGKLHDRRIAAHENVLRLALEMRVMVAPGHVDETGKLYRTPQILLSKEGFESWFEKFTLLSMEGTSWLTNEVKREINFVQDYLATLHMHLNCMSPDKYSTAGAIVRQDFIDLSSSLEKKAFSFFEHDILQLRLDSLEQHHKYKRDLTLERLNSTVLMKNMVQIRSL